MADKPARPSCFLLEGFLFYLSNETAMEIIDSVTQLSVAGNRLKALKGDRDGQHSIRINDQFRVCFRWTDSGAEDVEIVDYH
jgi:toxin HigB-1